MEIKHSDPCWLEDIEIVGGHPALDFINTIHSRTEPGSRDYLETPEHLLQWCRHLGLVDAHQARPLGRLSSTRGARLLGEARALRTTLHAVFVAHLCEKPNPAALAQLNRKLQALVRWRLLSTCQGGFTWQYRVTDRHPVSLLAPIAFAAAELLRSPKLSRLKACPPPDGCGWLFLDRSRNGRRTWCNMHTCGNIAKQRRHRARLPPTR